jgi:hypothetical protein
MTYTFSRTHLDVGSAFPQNSTCTTHNTHQRQTLTHPAILEFVIPASEKAYTHALDGAATGIVQHKSVNNDWFLARLKAKFARIDLLRLSRLSTWTALSMLNTGAWWQRMVKATPQLLYPRERETVPNKQSAGRASCVFRKKKKNIAPFGARAPHHPARSIQLCRLSYPSVVKIW